MAVSRHIAAAPQLMHSRPMAGNTTMKRAYVAGTFDTKARELLYLRAALKTPSIIIAAIFVGW